MAATKEDFEKVCELAKQNSVDEGCTVHVNATVQLGKDGPYIAHYCRSDWYVTEATVMSYTNGREH